MNAIEQLKAVLCDQAGRCCISGSDEDRAIVDRALQALAHPQPQPVGVFREDDDIGHVELCPYQQAKLQDGDKLYTSPQAQPLSADASPIFVLLAVEESIKNGECPWQIEQAFDEYEARRQSEITKGKT